MSSETIRIENGVKVADVYVGEKQYTVKAKRVKELEAILSALSKDKSLQKEGDAVQNIENMVKMCKIMFPEIDPEDIDNAYTSQLLELIDLWQELNFSKLQEGT